MRIVAISDSHLRHLKYDINIPHGDILIHAGDGTFVGDEYEIKLWLDWLASQDATHIVTIAGNHDWLPQKDSATFKTLIPSNVTYLQDSEVTVEGVRIYGAPWSPEFCQWAFNIPRGPAIKEKWDLIPPGLDILITHGPPFGYGDLSIHGERLGDEDLFDAIVLKRPKISIHGHIHAGRGVYHMRDLHQYSQTMVVNAALCDEEYVPSNKPIVIDYEPGGQPIVSDI